MKITNRSSFIMDFGLHIALAIFVLGIFTHAVKGASVDIVEGDEWYYFNGRKEPPFKWIILASINAIKTGLRGEQG